MQQIFCNFATTTGRGQTEPGAADDGGEPGKAEAGGLCEAAGAGLPAVRRPWSSSLNLQHLNRFLNFPPPASCDRLGSIGQTLEGSFSAVSKRNFARKYAFESSCRDLHNALLCTALQSHFCQKFAKNFSEFFRILQNYLFFFEKFRNFLTKF